MILNILNLSFNTAGFFEIQDDLILKLSSEVAGGTGYGQQSKFLFMINLKRVAQNQLEVTKKIAYHQKILGVSL